MYAIVSLAITFICYTGEHSEIFLKKIIFFFSIFDVWVEAEGAREEEGRVTTVLENDILPSLCPTLVFL